MRSDEAGTTSRLRTSNCTSSHCVVLHCYCAVQSFTSVLANTFMTALALWIPLTPLLFILRRIIEERSGTRWDATVVV